MKQSISVGYSRYLARQKIKQVMPNLSSDIIVHHKDNNPFNNDLDNLDLIPWGQHSRHHLKKAWKQIDTKDNIIVIRDKEYNEVIAKWNIDGLKIEHITPVLRDLHLKGYKFKIIKEWTNKSLDNHK